MANRGSFSGRIGFILAASGSAVGLSNIWRFPYLTGQNGGALFVLIYLVCVFLFCFPVLIGEIAIGRAAGRDAYGSYTKLGNRKWGMLGLFGILSGISILSYYNVVAGWALGYFLELSFGSLLSSVDQRSFFSTFISDPTRNIIYSFTFIAFTALCVIGGIRNGIERANKILMPGLFIMLLLLIAYGLTLPGALQGIYFYLVPDFSNIRMQTVFDAFRQSFFSLSIGVGGLITYGSYVRKDENLVRSASLITIMDTTAAFLAGFMIFPFVFSAGQSPQEGPPLVFIVLPEIFRDLGIIGRICGGGFFLLLCFATITSCISLLELATAYFIDEKKLRRRNVVLALSALIFVLGIPSILSFSGHRLFTNLSFYHGRDFFTLVADMTDISLTLGGCLMCLFISRRWKMANLEAELQQGNSAYQGSVVQVYLRVAIGWICPILLGAMSLAMLLDKVFMIF